MELGFVSEHERVTLPEEQGNKQRSNSLFEEISRLMSEISMSLLCLSSSTFRQKFKG